jgi:hypothetical protein
MKICGNSKQLMVTVGSGLLIYFWWRGWIGGNSSENISEEKEN